MDRISIIQAAPEIGLLGGSENAAFELHRAWLARGVDARVVTGHTNQPEVRQGVILTIPKLNSWIRRFGSEHLVTILMVPINSLVATWRLWKARGSGIVVSHGDSFMGDVFVIHSVTKANLIEKKRRGHYSWLFNPIHLWVMARDWWLFRGGHYRQVVAVSERLRRQLKQHYRVPDEKIAVIPNGVNLWRFSPRHATSRAKVRSELGIAEDVPLLLFVGHDLERKGLSHVIEALGKMRTTACLLVAGTEGEARYRELAERLGISERLIFAGKRSDIHLIYPAADAFVLPSRYETFSLLVLEAMASGVPVLASPVGSIEDCLRDGENGLYIQRDAEDIAVKVDRLFSDANQRSRLRERGLATARQYAWGIIADRYLALLEKLEHERQIEQLAESMSEAA